MRFHSTGGIAKRAPMICSAVGGLSRREYRVCLHAVSVPLGGVVLHRLPQAATTLDRSVRHLLIHAGSLISSTTLRGVSPPRPSSGSMRATIGFLSRTAAKSSLTHARLSK